MGLPGLSDIPVVNDIYNAVRGNPDAIKGAYDQQIAASKAAQQQLQQFLMGQKGGTLAYYAPIQHMFQRAYGTEGIQGPIIPGAQPPQAAPQVPPYRGAPPAPPMPGGHSFGGR